MIKKKFNKAGWFNFKGDDAYSKTNSSAQNGVGVLDFTEVMPARVSSNLTSA